MKPKAGDKFWDQLYCAEKTQVLIGLLAFHIKNVKCKGSSQK